MSATRVLFRLEMAEALRSRWLLFTGVVYALVFGLFVWLGLRESTVLGFTGLSRVVLNVTNAVVLAVPLVALVSTSQSLVRARQSGFFELMMTQPMKRSAWLLSAMGSRLLVVLGPLVILLLVALALGSDPVITSRALAVTASLAIAFVGMGFWISSVAKTPERATVLALVAWLLASALHDFALIGLLLRFKMTPQIVFGLAALNPVEAARVAILSGVDPELSVLGPVGFWLANTLGPTSILLIGVLWPTSLGAFAAWRAARRLHRSDLI
jgi:ABC-2 type transport system permease protein